MSTTKGRNLGLRLDENDTRDLEDFERGSGIEATTLARNALRACLAYWKQHQKISFPLRLVEAASADPGPARTASSAPLSEALAGHGRRSQMADPQPEAEKTSPQVEAAHSPRAERFKQRLAERRDA